MHDQPMVRGMSTSRRVTNVLRLSGIGRGTARGVLDTGPAALPTTVRYPMACPGSTQSANIVVAGTLVSGIGPAAIHTPQQAHHMPPTVITVRPKNTRRFLLRRRHADHGAERRLRHRGPGKVDGTTLNGPGVEGTLQDEMDQAPCQRPVLACMSTTCLFGESNSDGPFRLRNRSAGRCRAEDPRRSECHSAAGSIPDARSDH